MQPTSPEEPLLPRVARGEPAAVEACMQRYAPLVWSLARRLSRDASTAEELVQEIFVELWRHAARFDPSRSSEATFVALIARRRVIDRRRRDARTPTAESLDETQLETGLDPLRGVEVSDEARHAQRALEQLRPEQRRLILLSVVDGLTHQEIALRSGMPLGTIKSHIRRGLERAAEILGERRPGSDA